MLDTGRRRLGERGEGRRHHEAAGPRAALAVVTILLVDGNNVIGSVPDGWWRDRPGAVRRLLARLQCLAATTDESVQVVFDVPQADLPEGEHDGVVVHYATRRGSRRGGRPHPSSCSDAGFDDDVEVVTSDRELADAARRRGADVVGAGTLLRPTRRRRLLKPRSAAQERRRRRRARRPRRAGTSSTVARSGSRPTHRVRHRHRVTRDRPRLAVEGSTVTAHVAPVDLQPVGAGAGTVERQGGVERDARTGRRRSPRCAGCRRCRGGRRRSDAATGRPSGRSRSRSWTQPSKNMCVTNSRQSTGSPHTAVTGRRTAVCPLRSRSPRASRRSPLRGRRAIARSALPHGDRRTRSGRSSDRSRRRTPAPRPPASCDTPGSRR